MAKELEALPRSGEDSAKTVSDMQQFLNERLATFLQNGAGDMQTYVFFVHAYDQAIERLTLYAAPTATLARAQHREEHTLTLSSAYDAYVAQIQQGKFPPFVKFALLLLKTAYPFVRMVRLTILPKGKA